MKKIVMLMFAIVFLASLVVASDYSDYKVNGNFIGYERNGLIWAANDESGVYNWDDAVSICEDKEVHGVKGWRLATISELGDGTDNCGDSHTCSVDNDGVCSSSQTEGLIPGFGNEWYWTSTGMELANDYKCVVGFGTGFEVVPNPRPRVGWLYWADMNHTILYEGKVRCVIEKSTADKFKKKHVSTSYGDNLKDNLIQKVCGNGICEAGEEGNCDDCKRTVIYLEDSESIAGSQKSNSEFIGSGVLIWGLIILFIVLVILVIYLLI